MSQKLSTYRENAIVHDLDFNVMQSFHIVDRVGKGAYGIVWKAIEKRNGRQVAIKKILNAFRGDSDAQRTYREITFLKYLRSHPNIVTLFAVYRSNIFDRIIFEMFIKIDVFLKIGQLTIKISIWFSNTCLWIYIKPSLRVLCPAIRKLSS